MKTLKTVEIIPVYLDGYMPEFELMKEGHLYISLQYGVSIHACLCGCREKTVLPLILPENKVTDGWVLTDYDGKISFTPSILNNQVPCKSHYIITNNKANFV